MTIEPNASLPRLSVSATGRTAREPAPDKAEQELAESYDEFHHGEQAPLPDGVVPEEDDV
jgi:hypothetical protein